MQSLYSSWISKAWYDCVFPMFSQWACLYSFNECDGDELPIFLYPNLDFRSYEANCLSVFLDLKRLCYPPQVVYGHILHPALTIHLFAVNWTFCCTPNRIVWQGAHPVATEISMVATNLLVLLSSGALHLLPHLPTEVICRPPNTQVHSNIKVLRHMVHIPYSLLQIIHLLDGISTHLLLLHFHCPMGHMTTMHSQHSR